MRSVDHAERLINAKKDFVVVPGIPCHSAGAPLGRDGLAGLRRRDKLAQGGDQSREGEGIGPNMTQRFTYAIDKRYLPLLVPFGFRRSKDGVTLSDDGSFLATFGFVKVATPLSNITGAHITRHYRWWTAFGARGSMVDDGLSFGTNHSAGVCIHFAEKVPSPLRRSGHSALTVTVADLDGLTSALGGDDGEPPTASTD